MAVAGIVLGSMATGLMTAGNSGKQSEGLAIYGAATITLHGPQGQTLGVWRTHNSLVPIGISYLVACLVGHANGAFCPSSTNLPFTEEMQVAYGTCLSAASSPCASVIATNTMTPLNCLANGFCTGWVASATFPADEISSGCTPYFAGNANCPLNDVGTFGDGGTAPGELSPVQFDDICSPNVNLHGGNCASPYNNLPSILISAGDSLSINIQFTVS